MITTAAGYVAISAPGHPRAHGSGSYVFEHILVVERALGKFLDRKHPVHHVDENPGHNSNSNLVACEDQAYHLLLHQRQRALDATGNPSALPCQYCASYERPDEMVEYRRRSGSRSGLRFAYHPSCRNDARREAYRLKRAPMEATQQ